jgi:hypothetical protein
MVVDGQAGALGLAADSSAVFSERYHGAQCSTAGQRKLSAPLN